MKKILLTAVMLLCIVATLCACGKTAPPAASSETAVEVPEAVVIRPLENPMDLEMLSDCTLAVSIKEGDVYKDEEGNLQMKATVYTYDVYDMVDIAALKEGDTVERLGEEVTVSTVERRDDGAVIINGGIENGGFELICHDTTVFYETRENDAKAYYALGEVVLPVADTFVFTDARDLDKDPMHYTASEMLAEDANIEYHFVPSNAQIILEGGVVTALQRVYIP